MLTSVTITACFRMQKHLLMPQVSGWWATVLPVSVSHLWGAGQPGGWRKHEGIIRLHCSSSVRVLSCASFNCCYSLKGFWNLKFADTEQCAAKEAQCTGRFKGVNVTVGCLMLTQLFALGIKLLLQKVTHSKVFFCVLWYLQQFTLAGANRL